MTGEQLMQEIVALGGQLSINGDRVRVEAPEGVLTPELKAAITEHKAELLELLRQQNNATYLDDSLHRFQFMNVAVRIESDEFGTIRLVSDAACRNAVDTADPVYTAREARYVVELAPQHIQLLHGFKKQFPDASWEWRES